MHSQQSSLFLSVWITLFLSLLLSLILTFFWFLSLSTPLVSYLLCCLYLSVCLWSPPPLSLSAAQSVILPGRATIPYKAGGSLHLHFHFHIRSAVRDRVYTGSTEECYSKPSPLLQYGPLLLPSPSHQVSPHSSFPPPLSPFLPSSLLLPPASLFLSSSYQGTSVMPATSNPENQSSGNSVL